MHMVLYECGFLHSCVDADGEYAPSSVLTELPVWVVDSLMTPQTAWPKSTG